MALEQKKFVYAVDLAEKTMEKNTAIPDDFREKWHDQFLKGVVPRALKSDDTDSARYSVKKTLDALSKAESLIVIAQHSFEKSDMASTVDSFDEALTITEKAEKTDLRLYTFFRLISSIQQIDKSRIGEITNKTAKAVDEIPTLNADDKPETEKFNRYVTSLMSTNYNLLPVLKSMNKTNPGEAADLADRINKKEVKIIANFVIEVEKIEAGIKVLKNIPIHTKK